MDLLYLPFSPSEPTPPQPNINTLEPQAQTAAQQVLHLPELLECVLLHLSQKDLLLSQRVCVSFHETVQTSPKLQRALFFQPDPKLPTEPYSREENGLKPCPHPGRKPENNRLLLRAFPGAYPTVTLVIRNDPPSREDLAVGRPGAEQWSWVVSISFPANTGESRLPASCSPAVHYPEASWRRMYLCQPPCESLHLVRKWQRSVNAAFVREEGITMGDFVDEATKTQERWHPSYISSDRDWHFEGNVKCSKIEE